LLAWIRFHPRSRGGYRFRFLGLVRPALPPFLSRAKIMNLRVGNPRADILVVRHEDDVTVNILRQDGEIEVVIVI
jgi:hypothetical protein